MDISLSAGKAILVFKAICDFGRPCTVTEVVDVVGYPRTVTVRMLGTLEHHSLVERDAPSGRYSVSPMMLHYVHKALASNPVLSRVELILREIVDRTQDTALFMIRSGRQALVINRIEGSAPVRVLASEVGMELPLHCGGAPLTMLAYSSAEDIDAYLAGPLEKRTQKTVTDPAAIRARIAEVRAAGFSVGDQDMFDYVVGVGAPIFDSHGALAGAVSVGNITQRYTPERVQEVGRILSDTIAKF
ncbi:IclR family transcriptional regulator [Mangrovicoccus ximenensis]|uniref:IclR family transcriptional regulator n=1 Tax=Mangrovicoccus ximenensis TaxID=1911570 RepID=UPI00137513D4|nr:IclR family transcriptional regulator [Mangrovicoccus ximenensis]